MVLVARKLLRKVVPLPVCDKTTRCNGQLVQLECANGRGETTWIDVTYLVVGCRGWNGQSSRSTRAVNVPLWTEQR